jgi:acyl-CoA thioester hydrolase/thioesterase-3
MYPWGYNKQKGSSDLSDTRIGISVRCTEIDVNGHVNNTKYLEYYEWGREDWYEQHNLPYDALSDQGIITVVARAEVDYRAAAKQNDQLWITSRLLQVGRTSFHMQQKIVGDTGEIVNEALFVIVTVDRETGKPVPVPTAISQHLSGKDSNVE